MTSEASERPVTKVRYFSADEKTRWLIESYEKARRDELMRLNDALEEGEAKGFSIGKAEGRAEGKAEGRAEERERIAINMLDAGMSGDQVTRLSGLSADRVAELDRARRSGR